MIPDMVPDMVPDMIPDVISDNTIISNNHSCDRQQGECQFHQSALMAQLPSVLQGEWSATNMKIRKYKVKYKHKYKAKYKHKYIIHGSHCVISLTNQSMANLFMIHTIVNRPFVE